MMFQGHHSHLKNLLTLLYHFIRGIISIEMGIEDSELLDNIYEKYMDSDFKFINDRFEDLKNEIERENLEMRDEKKDDESFRRGLWLYDMLRITRGVHGFVQLGCQRDAERTAGAVGYSVSDYLLLMVIYNLI